MSNEQRKGIYLDNALRLLPRLQEHVGQAYSKYKM